jgi:hypothetical protein
VETQHKTALAILSHHMDEKGVLGRETLARVKHGIELCNNHEFGLLITSGWAYREDSDLPIADAVSNFIRQNFKLGATKIVEERNARDTVGDAFFIRKNVVVPEQISELHVVTSDYHVERTEKIFEFVMGNVCTTYIHGAKVELDDPHTIYEHEVKSTLAFDTTFHGVSKGDIQNIELAMKTRHPFYNGFRYSTM